MSSRVEVVKLIDGLSLAGGATRTTHTIDMRVFAPRIEAIVARGIASVSQPEYKIEWAGGITTAEVSGSPTGESDRFQIFDEADVAVPADNCANDDLINTSSGGTHGLGTEEWIIAPFPEHLWPFVRFRLTSAGGSPTATFDLYAVIRRRFDS